MRKGKQDVLMWALKTVKAGNAITLDTETTGLDEPHAVEIAVCNVSTLTVVERRVKPLKASTAKAIATHGISDEEAAKGMPFNEAWAIFAPLITGKDLVIFNGPYDTEVLQCSADAYGMGIPMILSGCTVHCCMRQYATYYGETGYYDNYKWQSLDRACGQLKLKIEGKPHSAASDALMTAKIVLRLAEIAEAELSEELRLQCMPIVSQEA
jgi:DNA polymerase III epsilon subunit-like protein